MCPIHKTSDAITAAFKKVQSALYWLTVKQNINSNYELTNYMKLSPS
jgi:hypothetical protein